MALISLRSCSLQHVPQLLRCSAQRALHTYNTALSFGLWAG